MEGKLIITPSEAPVGLSGPVFTSAVWLQEPDLPGFAASLLLLFLRLDASLLSLSLTHLSDLRLHFLKPSLSPRLDPVVVKAATFSFTELTTVVISIYGN